MIRSSAAPLWIVQLIIDGVTTTTPTTNPMGQEITIVGGPNATANIVGSHNDPADLYGIVAVLIAMAVCIVVARWVFGRRGPSRPARS